MGVYIKGMEMPKTYPLTVTIYPDGQVLSETVGAKDKHGIAVPVPPHGDLVDRDALSKSLDRLCDRVCQYSKAQRKVMCGACPLGDAFAVVEDDAPTIIPPSGGKEDE